VNKCSATKELGVNRIILLTVTFRGKGKEDSDWTKRKGECLEKKERERESA